MTSSKECDNSSGSCNNTNTNDVVRSNDYRTEQQRRIKEARQLRIKEAQKQLQLEQQKKFAQATSKVLNSPTSTSSKKFTTKSIDFTGNIIRSSASNNSSNNNRNEVPQAEEAPTSPIKSSIKNKKGNTLVDSDSDRTTEPTTKMIHDDIDDDDDDDDIEAATPTPKEAKSSSTSKEKEEGSVTVVSDLSQYKGDTLEDQLKSFVQAHPVVMFNKTWCLFSIDAQAFLTKQMNVDVHVIEVDTHTQSKSISNFIQEQTGHTTVPAIFIKGEFLGGFDHVNSLYATGQLQTQYLNGLSQADKCEEFLNKSGIQSTQPFFWFPSTVNAHVVRSTGIITSILSALSAATTYYFVWGKYIAYGLFFDFILRLFGGSKFSIIGQIATLIVNYVLRLEPKPRHGRPKQFATMCGLMFSGMASLMFLLQPTTPTTPPTTTITDFVGIGFMAGLACACGMEGFLDFCVGCFIFKWGIKLGLIPK